MSLFSDTYPIPAFEISCIGKFKICFPSNLIEPSVLTIPMMLLITVLLPTPFRPNNDTISPSLTLKLIPCNI